MKSVPLVFTMFPSPSSSRVELYSIMSYYTPVRQSVKRPPTLRSEQAAQTRQRIVDAAQRVFSDHGFVGARIEDIALAAGVAVPTVYKVFANKRNLLVGAVARAMTGGDNDTKVDDQAWWIEQLEEPDPARQLRLIARNARRIYDRAGPVLEAMRAAVPLDADIARTWEEVSADRFRRSRRTAKRLVAKAGQSARLNVEETALTLWSLTGPELHTVHIRAGRTPDQYERWLAHVLLSSLLAPT
jgi:AcrR family transcriptional regulator